MIIKINDDSNNSNNYCISNNNNSNNIDIIAHLQDGRKMGSVEKGEEMKWGEREREREGQTEKEKVKESKNKAVVRMIWEKGCLFVENGA